MLFTGRAEVINVFLVLIAVDLSRHAAAATAADKNTGEQIHLVLFGRSAGIDPSDPLHQVKVMLADDSLMCAGDADPLG